MNEWLCLLPQTCNGITFYNLFPLVFYFFWWHSSGVLYCWPQSHETFGDSVFLTAVHPTRSLRGQSRGGHFHSHFRMGKAQVQRTERTWPRSSVHNLNENLSPSIALCSELMFSALLAHWRNSKATDVWSPPQRGLCHGPGWGQDTGTFWKLPKWFQCIAIIENHNARPLKCANVGVKTVPKIAFLHLP